MEYQLLQSNWEQLCFQFQSCISIGSRTLICIVFGSPQKEFWLCAPFLEWEQPVSSCHSFRPVAVSVLVRDIFSVQALTWLQAQKAVLPYARCLNVPDKNIESFTTSSQHFGLLRCCYLLLPTILQKYAKTSQISDQWMITTTGKWFCSNLATIASFFQLLLTNVSTMYLASFLITSSQSRQGWCRNLLLDWQPKPQEESEIMHASNNPQKKVASGKTSMV